MERISAVSPPCKGGARGEWSSDGSMPALECASLDPPQLLPHRKGRKKLRPPGIKRRQRRSLHRELQQRGRAMLDEMDNDRRGFLKCMAWAGTGALLAFDGGIGTSIGLDSALAAPMKHAATKPFTFVQLSDSH